MITRTYRQQGGRLVGVSTSVVLAIAVLVVPGTVVAFEHSPWSPIVGALSALEEGRFSDIPGYFCDEQQEHIRSLDFEAALASAVPEGVELRETQGAFGFKVEGLGATPTDAAFPPPPVTTMAVTASVRQAIDPEQVLALFEAFLAGGADESGAQSTLDSIVASYDTEQVEISEDLTVVQTDGEEFDHYLICSNFVGLETLAGISDTSSETAADAEE